MSAEVVPIRPSIQIHKQIVEETEVHPDDILDAARGKLECLVIIGWTEAGELYMNSTTDDLGELLLMMEQAKAWYMENSE